jgi:peroxiredoxin
MFPHERSLVERLKNEPFVILGINTDSKGKDFYRQEAKTNGITWRSAIDGSTSGPICTKWDVHSFPTLYLIDAKGVIRQAWNVNGSPGDEVIDKEVDKLVAEAKAK